MTNSLPQVFSFPKTTHFDVRTITQNDEIWFVAADVCKILDIVNVSDAVSNLDEDEKTTIVITDSGSNYKHPALLVDESGLYHLIFQSRKEDAKQFRRWVTKEVLPSIRKTGSYSMPVAALPQGAEEDTDTLILRYVERLHNPTARDLGRYLTRYSVAEIRFHLHDLTEQGKLQETRTSHSFRYEVR